MPIAPSQLASQFGVECPNQAYAGDITDIPTTEGWLYLAVVIDLYSRQVVRWYMADNMGTERGNEALLMAIWKRKPKKAYSDIPTVAVSTHLIIEVFYNRQLLHSHHRYLSPVDFEKLFSQYVL